jgi:alkaline phosphatase
MKKVVGAATALMLGVLVLTRAPIDTAAAYAQPAEREQAAEPPRIVLVIGDGMGLAQWSLLPLTNHANPNVARLPHIGLVDTRCLCTRTTDSGASATAYATGHRVPYRHISMTADSTPLETVLEIARGRGMATGLVTTTHITDATPAAFAAHVRSRYLRFEIARQMAEQQIDVLLGGGYHFFARRPDGRNLLDELRARYTIVRSPAEFRALDVSRTERLLGLFADSTMWGQQDVRPSLPELAGTALAIVDRNPNGFFLMLESEDTDDAFHDHLPVREAVRSVRELDAMIGTVLEYQRRRSNTLVVVIGDHETGGFVPQVLPDSLGAAYTTGNHSAVMVPVFAAGPGAEAFGRWLTNAEVGMLLRQAVLGEPLQRSDQLRSSSR